MKKFLKSLIIVLVLTTSAIAGSDGENELSKKKAGQINGKYSDFDWTPVRYLNKGFDRKVLAGFFRNSSVGLVTPLRDGMNLVAKEYVASQSSEDPGVLVLSQFAGAAEEMDGAVLVNPYNTNEISKAIKELKYNPKTKLIDELKKIFNEKNI